MANILTGARIFLVLPFIFAFTANAAWNMKAALAIYVIAAATDFLDGYVARARNDVTPLGRALDPIADKLLITAALILLVRNGVLHGVESLAAILLILREVFVSGLREALAGKAAQLPVTGLAKAKTTMQMIAGGLLLAATPTGLLGDDWRALALASFWLAVALTIWTGVQYALRAIAMLNSAPADDGTA